jgi:YbgC/YbaW family acyl-CoA thioester hydrolase
MPFRYTRRVQFADTDLVGIVHFSNFFRYMDEAEHALWRAAGLSIAQGGDDAGWPRVSAAFDYKAPLHFEDEVEIEVALTTVTRRTLHYTFTMTRGTTFVGKGTVTAVCARKRDGALESIPVPDDIVSRLRAAIERAGG